MNETQALLERAERGTLRGPDTVWAAAQRRHRPQLLVSAALAAFVLLAVAVLLLAVRGSSDPAPSVAAVPPSANVEPTTGRIPTAATRPDGSVDLSLIPDFIVTEDRDGNVVGYVAKTDLFPGLTSSTIAGDPSNPPQSPPVPVYSLDDHSTIVGYHYPAKGFVPLGTNPDDVPSIPINAGP